MRLFAMRVVHPIFLSFLILSCATQDAVGPTLPAVNPKPSFTEHVPIGPKVVISQVYGGGGNSGATYNRDFVELFNAGDVEQSLTGWSLQYASATGTGNFGSTTTQITPLSGSIAAGQYVLVEGAGGSTGAGLAADIIDASPINLAAGAGKVALVKTAASIGCNGGSTLCNAAALAQVVDLVGYGNANFFEGATAAPALSNTTAAFRKGNGCSDTDENGADFVAGTPFPQNRLTDPTPCGAGVAQEAATVTVRVSWVTPGTSFRITATVVGSDGRPASPNLTWTSEPATIASIHPTTGVATGASLGVATVTATAPNGVSGSAPLFVVNPGDVANVSLSVNDPDQAPVGFTKPAFPTSRTTTNAVVTPELEWSSSDERIATVTNRGYITGVSVGSAKIRATAPNGVYGEVAFTVIPATAPTSANYGNALEFGTPTDDTPHDELILTKPQYTTSYNKNRGGPNWVSWVINASHFGDAPRCDCFSADQSLPSDVYHVVDFDYRDGGYDRGHVVQSESRTTTDQENASTFLLTNILPQGAENNQGPWSKFENYLNDLARTSGESRKEIYVIAGGRYGLNPATLKNEGKVAIPDYTWKVAVIMRAGKGLSDVQSSGDLEVIAVEMPNLTTPGVEASSVGIRNNPWEQYKKTVDEIEAQTGYDVLSGLQDQIERIVESGKLPLAAEFVVSPDRINLNGQGNGQVIVTIFGTTAIDVAAIDLQSIHIGTVGIDTNGNGGSKSSVKDVNKDGRADLVVHFDRADLLDGGRLTTGISRLVLHADLTDGRQIEAWGAVKVGSKD
jgi:DNA/RNA endonuclease G (NUC1)